MAGCHTRRLTETGGFEGLGGFSVQRMIQNDTRGTVTYCKKPATCSFFETEEIGTLMNKNFITSSYFNKIVTDRSLEVRKYI